MYLIYSPSVNGNLPFSSILDGGLKKHFRKASAPKGGA